ncbi:MAG: M50 family metallopeptidase [Deltaproteobacteria bacterium]|nr:M50 family metallopeptidase [Deltaproteobacteria bacterium]
MAGPDRRELRTLAIALLASLLLWNLPFGGLVLYPFKLLATWLHELSHGIVMTLTGPGFDYIVIFRDTSGLAYSQSSMAGWGLPFIAAAGYMGTPLWGAVLLRITPTPERARIALAVLGVLLVISAFTVVAVDDGGDAFGPYAIGVMGAVFIAAAFLVPARIRRTLAHFVAAQACINALLDIRVLLRPSQVVGGSSGASSDATNMAASTFGTTADWAVWTWAGIWILWSLLVLYVSLKLSGSPASSSAAPDDRPTAAPRDESDRDARRRSPAIAPGGTGPSGPAGTAGP